MNFELITFLTVKTVSITRLIRNVQLDPDCMSIIKSLMSGASEVLEV